MNRVKQLVHAENVYRMGYTGKNIRVVTLDTEHMLAEFCVRMAE